MKIIFLDIDGVLNSERSFLAGSHKIATMPDVPYCEKVLLATIDPIAVDLVNKICEEVDAYIVLSSTHRLHCDTIDDVRDYLAAIGINRARVFSATPRLNTIRGIEIQTWIDDRPGTVTAYVIIDDSRDTTPGQIAEHFVHCDGLVGLDSHGYFNALRILGCPVEA